MVERDCSLSLGIKKKIHLLQWLNRVMVLVSVESKEQQGDIVDGDVADGCKKAESLLQSIRNKDIMGQLGSQGT